MKHPMTVVQKIIAQKSNRDSLEPGEIVPCKVDLACIDDIQFSIFEEKFDMLNKPIFDKNKICLIADHYLPPSTVQQAEAVKKMRDFGIKFGLKHLYIHEGIKHQLIMEKKLAYPGDIIAATDSHTLTAGALGSMAISLGPTDLAVVASEGYTWLRVPETIRIDLHGNLPKGVFAKDISLKILGDLGTNFGHYAAIEFGGEFVNQLDLAGRKTLCNMMTEASAKCAFCEVDKKTTDFFGIKFDQDLYNSDSASRYIKRVEYNVNIIEPLVAIPPGPNHIVPARCLQDVRIDQAVIGTCTNGDLADLETAALFLKNSKVAPNVRLLVIPASNEVYKKALQKGLTQIFMDSGAIVMNANCGPCAGIHEGVLASGEVMISTQSRNFTGRCGHQQSRIYLGSPATVAISAINGYISSPQMYI